MAAGITWGDTVQVKVGAAHEQRPGALAAVVGMRDVDAGKLYTIEFSDGSSIEIPEALLARFATAG